MALSPTPKLGSEAFAVSPLSLACPFCKTGPRLDCEKSAGGFAVVHVARIKKAATLDSLSASRVARKRTR